MKISRIFEVFGRMMGSAVSDLAPLPVDEAQDQAAIAQMLHVQGFLAADIDHVDFREHEGEPAAFIVFVRKQGAPLADEIAIVSPLKASVDRGEDVADVFRRTKAALPVAPPAGTDRALNL